MHAHAHACTHAWMGQTWGTAVRYWELAADANDGRALAQLAVSYYFGEGIGHNYIGHNYIGHNLV